MNDPRWTAIDDYVTGVFALEDNVLQAAVQASEDAALPSIQVSPPQGKLLHLLARAIGARSAPSSRPLNLNARAGRRSDRLQVVGV